MPLLPTRVLVTFPWFDSITFWKRFQYFFLVFFDFIILYNYTVIFCASCTKDSCADLEKGACCANSDKPAINRFPS